MQSIVLSLVTTNSPTPATWPGSGCPAAYAVGTEYSAGDSVSVTQEDGSYTGVYTCKTTDSNSNLWCGMAGYEPGTSQHWPQAWDFVGSCTGTISPTGSPSYDLLIDAGGCPGEYNADETYEENDTVSKDNFVYRCKEWPMSDHCSQIGYEPGNTDGTEYWKEAWTIVGYCSGTIAPTSSPSFVSLSNIGACPEEWVEKFTDSGDAYEEGDIVSTSKGMVYECKAWPFSAHCGQAGYKPEDADASTAGAWKDAWQIKGYCSGSMGPTSSPSFDTVNSVGACPDEWEFGNNVKYEEGDMVSVLVSTTPLRKVAFKCKAWPNSGHCGQYSPMDELGGDLGWTLAGSCDGSVGPTSSPSFDSLEEINGGCPPEFSLTEAAAGNYEAGDLVSHTVSSNPPRQIVYECKEWPNTGYCNQGGFAPGVSKYDHMGWKLLGSCSGSMAPTASPITYDNSNGACQYNKCIKVEQTQTNCTPGSSGCSCLSGDTAGVGCTKTVEVEQCTMTNVNAWSNMVDYVTDDVVRIGTKRYKCREWPNYLWCRMSAYSPKEEDNGVWPQAWTLDGDCPASP